MNHRNSQSKKANSKIPGLAAYKKPSAQLTLKLGKTKSRMPINNITSVTVKQELIDSTMSTSMGRQNISKDLTMLGHSKAVEQVEE